jgi:hypothetical protein
VTNSSHRDSFKISTNANNTGIGNKLVTIFAPHLDSFIVKQNLSSVYQIRYSGSGQIRNAGTNYLSPGLAKIAPWWLARRDSFLAKVPGLVSADGATNAYCPYQRAVSTNTNLDFELATHHNLVNFFMIRNIFNFYRDKAFAH